MVEGYAPYVEKSMLANPRGPKIQIILLYNVLTPSNAI